MKSDLEWHFSNGRMPTGGVEEIRVELDRLEASLRAQQISVLTTSQKKKFYRQAAGLLLARLYVTFPQGRVLGILTLT
jgi:hypothetical protein